MKLRNQYGHLVAASAALDTKRGTCDAINRATAKAVRFYRQHQVLRKFKTELVVTRLGWFEEKFPNSG